MNGSENQSALRPCSLKCAIQSSRGASLIEVLLGILIIVIAAIGTLSYFAYGLGGNGKSGNRRAALERARQRLEQLLEAKVEDIEPPADGQMYELTCTPDADQKCQWGVSGAPVTETTVVGEPTIVDDLPSQIATTVRWLDDPQTSDDDPLNPSVDVLELAVRVWCTPDQNPANATTFNRVVVTTLRTP